MRTLILYGMLSAVCCSSLSFHQTANEDFGLYCETIEGTNNRKIVIRAMYYVTAGKKQDSILAANGIAFWKRLNGDFFLRVDSGNKGGQEVFPIEFDLTLVVTKDPEGEKDRSDKVKKYPELPALPANTFYIVDYLEKCTQGPTNVNPDIADGLTCADYQIWIKREQENNHIAAAHEIGHTLGLPDCEDYGLMHKYNSGYTNVYESYIKKILHYSLSNIGNQFRNHYNFCVPSGTVFHRSRPKKAKGPDSDVEFKTENYQRLNSTLR